LKVRIMRDNKTCTDMSIDEEDMRYAESNEILEQLKEMKEFDDTKIMKELWDLAAWSDTEYPGTVVSVKDQCIFVRVLGAREVKVGSENMKASMVWTDPSSKVLKVKREVVKEGMQVDIRLKWDWERVKGSMIVKI